MLQSLFLTSLLFIAACGTALANDPAIPQGVTVPSWKQLSAEQQKDLSQFSLNWDTLPASRRVQILERYEKWKALPPKQRQALREGALNFQEMPPRQRAAMRESLLYIRTLPPEEQKRLRQLWMKLTPSQRSAWLDQGGPGIAPDPKL
jgi:Protein of unknown function (DUF3106)